MAARRRSSEALQHLQRVAEVASGDLRAAATDVEELADALARSQPGRAEALRMCGRRLVAVANTLTAEAQAASPKNVRHVMVIVFGILAATAPVLTGVGEGVGTALANRAIDSTERATQACDAAVDGAEAERLANYQAAYLEFSSLVSDAYEELDEIPSENDPDAVLAYARRLRGMVHDGPWPDLRHEPKEGVTWILERPTHLADVVDRLERALLDPGLC